MSTILINGLAVIALAGLLASIWSFTQALLNRRAAIQLGVNGEVEVYIQSTTISAVLKVLTLTFLSISLYVAIVFPRPIPPQQEYSLPQLISLASLTAMAVLIGLNSIHDVIAERRAAAKHTAGKTIEEAVEAVGEKVAGVGEKVAGVGEQVDEVHVLVNNKMDKALDRIEQLTQALIAIGGVVPPTPPDTNAPTT